MPPARVRVEDRQEILVEVEDRVWVAGSDCEDHRVKAVHRVQKHGEADTDHIENLRLRQHTERGPHQGMLGRHVQVGRGIDWSASALADEQKAEGERLRKGRGEQNVKVLRRVAARLGVRIKDGLKLGMHVEQRVRRDRTCAQFCQPVSHDTPHESRGMGKKIGQMRSVQGGRLLTCGCRQVRHKGHQRCRVVLANQVICCRIGPVGVERLLWYDPGHAPLRRALE